MDEGDKRELYRGFIRTRFDEDLESKEEWWHSSNGDRYLELYDNLCVSHGLAPGVAYSTLVAAFWAAADEYGG